MIDPDQEDSFRRLANNHQISHGLLMGMKKKVYPEIGNDAIWTVSSCKRGLGVKNIRDKSTDTYWQSDGNQPHKIICQFRKREAVIGVLLFCDYKSDESYTPSKIDILCGNDPNDLRVIYEKTVEEPKGWIEIPIRNDFGNPIHTWMIQIVIKQNHQSGRDSHLRQVRILGPEASPENINCFDDQWTIIR